ncbi:MAG: 16S rRNA processing protein RimM [Ignavibacteriales bacterium]|nr:MAG: 16S rRNA processing protein RimM [Ignavibacteriales bacterium]
MNELYLIAKILSAGKDGFVKVQLVPGLNINLNSIKFLYLDFWGQKKTIELEEVLIFKQSVFFKFKNFENERETTVFIGRNVFVGGNDFEKIVNDVFLNQNLIGSKVYRGQDLLGTVTDYFETPANPVIEISEEDGTNFLIPYVDSVFEKIDAENKILILNSDFGIDDDED